MFDISISSYYGGSDKESTIVRLLDSIPSIEESNTVFIYAQKWPEKLLSKARAIKNVVIEVGDPPSNPLNYVEPRAKAFALAVNKGSQGYVYVADDDFEFKGPMIKILKFCDKVCKLDSKMGAIILAKHKHYSRSSAILYGKSYAKHWTNRGQIISRKIAKDVLSKFQSMESSYDDVALPWAVQELGYNTSLIYHGDGPAHHNKKTSTKFNSATKWINEPKAQDMSRKFDKDYSIPNSSRSNSPIAGGLVTTVNVDESQCTAILFKSQYI